MTRARLTTEERTFRKIGRGIPLSRIWHVPALLAAAVWASSAPLMYHCVGADLQADGYRADKGWAFVRLLLTYPCSPFLVQQGALGWLKLATLWVPIPAAIANYRWTVRHRRYWNKIREREAERRKARRTASRSG